MTALAPHLAVFLREHLPRDRACSPHTCESYAYAFQLLVCFAADRGGTCPSALTLEDLDARLVLDFLEHLENVRGNSATTRNVRLAAIKSFAHFMEYRLPSAIDQMRRILAIPAKKTDETLVPFLDQHELQALLDAPDSTARDGCRDRAMLHLGFAAGLRVSELVGLQVDDLRLHPDPCVHVRGKGRRRTPILSRSREVGEERRCSTVYAEKLAKLLFLDEVPEVYVPREDVRAWRRMIGHRRKLVNTRTRSRNAIRAVLYTSVFSGCRAKTCEMRIPAHPDHPIRAS